MGTVLVRSSEVRGNGRAGVLLKVRTAGMQGQELLGSLRVLEAQLTSLLLSGGPMGLFNEVIAPRRPDDLNVLHSVEHRKFSDGCP